jgi:hypothetical protein
VWCNDATTESDTNVCVLMGLECTSLTSGKVLPLQTAKAAGVLVRNHLSRQNPGAQHDWHRRQVCVLILCTGFLPCMPGWHPTW